MSVIKSLWASVQGDPVFMRRINGWFTIFWILMIPASIVLGLLSSVAYVSALSLWALVSGHWSAWQAARVEVAQQREVDKLDANPIEERVVDQLVEQTTIDRADGTRRPDGGHLRTGGGPELRSRVPDATALQQQIEQLVAELNELRDVLASPIA